jgi:hypothetical protein
VSERQAPSTRKGSRKASTISEGHMTSPNTSYTDVITTTLENRSKQAADNLTDNNALLTVLSEEEGGLELADGGREIVQELLYGENANGGWYSGYEALPTSPTETLTAPSFSWKQYAVPVVISGLEEMMNSGDEAVIPLLKSRIRAAEATMANAIALGLYSDGTTFGGKTITGLAAAVPVDPTTGTYGNINRATAGNEFWRSQIVDVSVAATSSTIRGYMNQLWYKCIRGKDAPKFIVGDNLSVAMYEESLQENARFTNAKLADAGFQNVEYKKCPVYADGGIGGNATASTMFFLNPKYLHWRPHRRRNMVPIGGDRMATNQDATVKWVGFMGNLTCSGAMFQGRLLLT